MFVFISTYVFVRMYRNMYGDVHNSYIQSCTCIKVYVSAFLHK